MQQRNSNLRELPVAPGNASMNSARPAATPTSPSANVRPVARATQGVRPVQNTQSVPDGGRGRGQVAAKTQLQPGGTGRTVVQKEIPSTPSNTAPQVSFLSLMEKIKEGADWICFKRNNLKWYCKLIIFIFFPAKSSDPEILCCINVVNDNNLITLERTDHTTASFP